MGKLGWNIAASIGLIVISQPASAASDVRVPMVVSAHRNVAQSDDPKYLLAQAAEPKETATAPAADSKKPQDQSSAPASSPPTETATVPRAEKTVPGCALKYMAAELSGKLKGRKWKEFRQQECGPGTAQVVFPGDGCAEILQGRPREGADTHLRGSIHRQQGQQRQRRPEMDRKERRLLQRVRRPPEGLNPSAPAAPTSARERLGKTGGNGSPALRPLRGPVSRPTSRSTARACAGRVRETTGSGRR